MSAPIRWKEAQSSADPELRELLHHAATRGPSEAQLATISARVKAGLAASAAPATQPATAASMTASVVKIGAWTALCMLAGVGAWSLWMGAAERPPRAAAPVVQHQSPLAAHERPAEITPPVVQEPRDEAPAPVEASVPAHSPKSRSARALASKQAPKPEASETDELQLLQQARVLQRKDPGAALAQLHVHEREHPEGAFREEREALMIELLAVTGERELMRARAQAFLARYPASAYRTRLAKWLEDAETPAP